MVDKPPPRFAPEGARFKRSDWQPEGSQADQQKRTYLDQLEDLRRELERTVSDLTAERLKTQALEADLASRPSPPFQTDEPATEEDKEGKYPGLFVPLLLGQFKEGWLDLKSFASIDTASFDDIKKQGLDLYLSEDQKTELSKEGRFKASLSQIETFYRAGWRETCGVETWFWLHDKGIVSGEDLSEEDLARLESVPFFQDVIAKRERERTEQAWAKVKLDRQLKRRAWIHRFALALISYLILATLVMNAAGSHTCFRSGNDFAYCSYRSIAAPIVGTFRWIFGGSDDESNESAAGASAPDGTDPVSASNETEAFSPATVAVLENTADATQEPSPPAPVYIPPPQRVIDPNAIVKDLTDHATAKATELEWTPEQVSCVRMKTIDSMRRIYVGKIGQGDRESRFDSAKSYFKNVADCNSDGKDALMADMFYDDDNYFRKIQDRIESREFGDVWPE